METTSFWLAVASVALAIASIGVAIYIALKQSDQQEALAELQRETAAGVAEIKQALIESDETGDGDAETDTPRDEDAFLSALRNAGAQLIGNLKWRRKTRLDGDGRGNLGWFVESPSGGERWFIHKGRVTSVRRAIPRDMLEKWERDARKKATEIQIDYQVKDDARASWFLKTYAGETWRVSKGGQGKRTITAVPVPS